MKTEAAAKQLRRELDEILIKTKRGAPRAPKRGWIHNVREALGMSTHQLAKRLKMSQSGLVMIEQSEARGAIQLSTLAKVAAAMECELTYALVPKAKDFDGVLEKQRYSVAELGLVEILHRSGLNAAERRELIKAYAARLKPKRIWEPMILKDLADRMEKAAYAPKKEKSRKRDADYVRGDEVIVPKPGAFLKGRKN